MSLVFTTWAIVHTLVALVIGFDEDTELIMLGIIASCDETICEHSTSGFRFLLISSVTSVDCPLAAFRKSCLIC